MNKTAIKNFAIWARNKLIASCEQKALMVGITEDGIADKLDVSTVDTEFYDIGTSNPYSISGKAIKQRRELVKAIQSRTENGDDKSAFHSIMEEVAYTWFNRLIALRFMEVNGYLKDDMRILSSVSAGKVEPDAVTSPFDWELEFSDEERDRVIQLQNNNEVDELFRLLFIKECNALNESLPYLFEKTEDYSEFLLSISVTDVEGVVYKLVHDIPEEDFNIEMGGQVEIIGWLYQYYNTEPKDKVFTDLKKNIKVTKEKIPAATQLFTPDWIVRYMVENSLGRIWVEKKLADGPQPSSLAFPSGEVGPLAVDEVIAKSFNWKYYLPEAEQEYDVAAQLEELHQDRKNIQPEDIKVIDPCMGSGHILVYAFDVLMDIYRESGYVDRDAAQSIIKNNLYGLDIDQRAFQLAYFAVMMKGRQYDRRMLTRNIEPNLCAIEDSNDLAFPSGEVGPLAVNNEALPSPRGEGGPLAVDEVSNLITLFHDAKEYGSILSVPAADYDKAMDYIDELKTSELDLITVTNIELLERKLPNLVKQAKIMAAKYDVVVTNPPYMGGSNMNPKLSAYVKKNYPDSKSDLFAVCIEKGNNWTKQNGFNCMVTMQSWMFLSSFEKMRLNILDKYDITNLMHMENMVMGIAFGTAVTVWRNYKIDGYKGTYNHVKLKNIQNDEPVEFPIKGNRFAQISTKNFAKIPGSPVVYWASTTVFDLYKRDILLSRVANAKQGSTLGDNNTFLRLWFEVTTRSNKWFPCMKGGPYRKWYGNMEYLVNWQNDGEAIKKTGKATIRSKHLLFKEGITWSNITSGQSSFRYMPKGFFFESSGTVCFIENDLIHYLLAFTNTPIVKSINSMINPTLHLQSGDVAKLPFITETNNIDIISNLCKNAVSMSKSDWDSFETSWDFEANPLVAVETSSDEPHPSAKVDTFPKGEGIDEPHPADNDTDGALLQVLLSASSDGKAGTEPSPMEKVPRETRRMRSLEEGYEAYKAETNARFAQLKANEEELNRIFIDIYGLSDELTPEVADKDVTVASIFDTKEDIPESYKGNNYVLTKEDVIKNLISYAVGCLFGRYSLDKPGLIYAGGDWDRISKESFSEADLAKGIPDNDNVIPITDEAYFEDDITGRFISWLKEAFGADNLEDNLAFIADALSVKGDNSRDVIRNYFLSGFYADHVKKYQKRPIYWLYDSGKNNGFKALIYMHRYDADTTGRVRMDYLHRMEQIYGDEINRVISDIQESTEAREKAKLQKRLSKLEKQVKECREYDESIGHLALERIAIDLDDGVKVNYKKVQTDRNGNIYKILGKI